MNIKNITCREKVPVEELEVDRHYYIVKNSNYLRIEIISVNLDENIVVFKVVTAVSPIQGAICTLNVADFHPKFYLVFTPGSAEYIERKIKKELEMERKEEAGDNP